MKRLALLVYILLSIFAFSSNASEKIKVIYPNVNSDGKNLFGYAVLKLALENSGHDFELLVTQSNPNNARVRKLIENKKISISDFGTSKQFEEELLPIYFPIDLGLNGWRIFVIKKYNQIKFNKVNSLSNLHLYKAGQGIGWSDVKILENSKLHVVESPNLASLFKMLDRQRFDYFPLGANEAHFLLQSFENKNSTDLIIEKNLLLIYPFARFFFVHKDNIELHNIVKKGLEKSFKNGTFWELFKSHKSNEALFKKANLKSRKQILIINPNMSDNFKKIPKEYFFNLNMLD